MSPKFLFFPLNGKCFLFVYLYVYILHDCKKQISIYYICDDRKTGFFLSKIANVPLAI